MRAFREAVEAVDHTAMEACLADNVRFTSPVVFKPYDGKAITAAIPCVHRFPLRTRDRQR